MTTQSAKALEILQTTNRPMSWMELVSGIPGSCGETVSRALRRLCRKGLVERQPQDPTKPNGVKLWTAKTASQLSFAPTAASASSSGKTTIMCLPQNKPTTVTATLQTLKEMLDAKKPFSAHDVTKKMRDDIKDGKISIDHTENGTVFAYGKTLARIEHDVVKDIVHDYFHANNMAGWTRELVNGHWEYREEAAQPNPQPPVILVAVASGDDYDGTPTL